MAFNLTQIDIDLIKDAKFTLDRVNDVGNHFNNIIRFQFPPVIKSDTKQTKWDEIDIHGFEPQYMYIGAKPRKIQVSTTYVIGGPSGPAPQGLEFGSGDLSSPGGNAAARFSGAGGGAWGIPQVTNQLRTWKKYFYFKNLASGGGVAIGKNLPIYRIDWGELLPMVPPGSAWRAHAYNVKYSDVWIRDEDLSHPLVTEISVNLEMVTRVSVLGQDGKPKQDLNNLIQAAPAEWY